MLIYIDRAGAKQFDYFGEDRIVDIRCYYCAVSPYRAILICHNGLELYALVGQTVDAVVGRDSGWREFVRPGNVNKPHSKISVYRLSSRPAQFTLTQILADAPRDE